jgi:hypothetical protein
VRSRETRRREAKQRSIHAAATRVKTEITSPSVASDDSLPFDEGEPEYSESSQYVPSDREDEFEVSPKMEPEDPEDPAANMFLIDEGATQTPIPLEPIAPARRRAAPPSPAPPATDPSSMEPDDDIDADLLSQFFASMQSGVAGGTRGTRAKMSEACKILDEQFYDVEGLQHVDNETWLLLQIPLGIGQRIAREAKRWLEDRQHDQAISRAVEIHSPLPDPVEVQVRRESILSGAHWV